jgi:hypothetical protein
MAKRILHDAKIDYPAACNAMVFSVYIPFDWPSFCVDLHLTVCSSSGSFCRSNFTLCFDLLSSLRFVTVSQETIIVHKDLLSNGGLDEIVFELQREGISSV